MKASILVRAYNAARTVERCIASALQQDFHGGHEIVLVDDGSADGTADIVEEMQESRIRIVRQANKGLVGASNAGVEAARGEVVLFLDADDELLPVAVSAVTGAMERSGADFAWGDYIEEHKSVRTNVAPANPFKAPMGAFAWRRKSVLALGGFGGTTIFPEYEIVLRAAGRWTPARIPAPLFVYHRRAESMTGNTSLVADAIQKLKEMYPDRVADIEKIRSYRLPD